MDTVPGTPQGIARISIASRLETQCTIAFNNLPGQFHLLRHTGRGTGELEKQRRRFNQAHVRETVDRLHRARIEQFDP